MYHAGSEQVDERESSKINGVLPSLLERNLITGIECRLILSCSGLRDKRAAIYTVIMARTKEEAAKLTVAIKSLTENIQTEEETPTVKPEDCKMDEDFEDNIPLEKMNPLLNNTVLTCLFGFLSLDEIKGSRFVCQQWNSTAEVYMRKRFAICFRRNGLQLKTFMEVSKYCFPNLPFSIFKFSNIDIGVYDGTSIASFENFFDLMGKRIKEITFENVRLVSSGAPVKLYDITPWIAKIPKLSILKIKCSKGAALKISIEKLLPLKTILLENCIVAVNSEIYTRPAPSKISLSNVNFHKLGKILLKYNYNDFFDFRVAANVSIKDNEKSGWLATFDMEGIQFSASQLRLESINVDNWEKAKGDIDFVRLDGCQFSSKKNQLNIKRFDMETSLFDLSVLPETIEKLKLGRNLHIHGSEPLQLTNLKYIALDLKLNNSEMLINFENCPSLAELEIIGETVLNVGCIPESVRKMSITASSNLRFVRSNLKLKLDTLILVDPLVDYDFTFSKTALENIEPNILVIRYNKCRLIHACHISKNVLANIHNIEKIAVGTLDGDAEKVQFEEVPLSECVDINSGCYIFENPIGRAITRKEFENLNKMDNIRDDPF